VDVSNPTIFDIAKLIAEGKVADDYQFFIILAVLALLTGLVVWFVAPYLGERGKLLAMAEKLEERLNDIRQTTEAAENVRTRIAHSDWTTKEYKTLLRNKLEQLMGAAYKTKSACEADANFKQDTPGDKFTSKEPSLEVELLSAMYFRVIEIEVRNFIVAHTNFSIWLNNAQCKLAQQQLTVDHEEATLELNRSAPGGILDGVSFNTQLERYRQASEIRSKLRGEYLTEYIPHASALAKTLQKLEDRAALLMDEFITPTTNA
jgi:hypothetical protein